MIAVPPVPVPEAPPVLVPPLPLPPTPPVSSFWLLHAT